MAIVNYTTATILNGFDNTAGAGTWTSLGTDQLLASTVDSGVDDIMSDGETGWSNNLAATYSGFHIAGNPIMTNGAAFILVHNAGVGVVTATGMATDENGVTLLCFLAKTLISTPAGDVAVESLSAGDVVITASGDTAPVKFVFKNTVEAISPFRARNTVMPVTIMAGALGEHVPSTDLQVSPDHALLIDGCLVEARTLINGVSIYQEMDFNGPIEYYHVEMDNHELIVANGTVAESFIDNVSRQTFDNYADYKALYPAVEVEMAELDYPRVKSARQLPKALHDSLAARAEKLVPGGSKKTA